MPGSPLRSAMQAASRCSPDCRPRRLPAIGGAIHAGGRVQNIRCPTLITSADADPLARGAQSFHDALTCPKAILYFTAAEAAGDHVETMNRSLLNRRALDWLDDMFNAD